MKYIDVEIKKTHGFRYDAIMSARLVLDYWQKKEVDLLKMQHTSWNDVFGDMKLALGFDDTHAGVGLKLLLADAASFFDKNFEVPKRKQI